MLIELHHAADGKRFAVGSTRLQRVEAIDYENAKAALYLSDTNVIHVTESYEKVIQLCRAAKAAM